MVKAGYRLWACATYPERMGIRVRQGLALTVIAALVLLLATVPALDTVGTQTALSAVVFVSAAAGLCLIAYGLLRNR